VSLEQRLLQLLVEEMIQAIDVRALRVTGLSQFFSSSKPVNRACDVLQSEENAIKKILQLMQGAGNDGPKGKVEPLTQALEAYCRALGTVCDSYKKRRLAQGFFARLIAWITGADEKRERALLRATEKINSLLAELRCPRAGTSTRAISLLDGEPVYLIDVDMQATLSQKNKEGAKAAAKEVTEKARREAFLEISRPTLPSQTTPVNLVFSKAARRVNNAEKILSDAICYFRRA